MSGQTITEKILARHAGREHEGVEPLRDEIHGAAAEAF